MVDNEDSVTKFLRSLCVEKCCITISYLYGCMMADSFKETYNLGVLTKILGFMFEENKNGTLFRIQFILLFVQTINEKKKYKQSSQLNELCSLINTIIASLNDFIMIDKSSLITLLFPSYKDIIQLLPHRKNKKTKKDGDYLQEDYYSRMNEVVNETKSSIVVEEQNKDSESYLQPVRRRKLIEVVDEEVNDLDDIFGVGGNEEEEFFKEEEKEKKANKENTTTPDVNDEYQPKRSV